MSKTIFKYQIKTDDQQTVKMPEGAKILTVQTRGGAPCMWALVDPSAPIEARQIEIYGTGHPMPDDTKTRNYIGTYQLSSGAFVFHVFEAIW